MARPGITNDPFIFLPGHAPSGCVVSAIGSVRSTNDGSVILGDRASNRPLAILDPSDFPGEHKDNPDLIIRDISRAVAQHNIGRKVDLPSWALIALD